MRGRLLRLVPLGLDASDRAVVAWLGSALAARMAVIPVEQPGVPLDPTWHDPVTGRFSSNEIVDALIAMGDASSADDWTLAIAAVDLVAPGREFVFGEATLGGPFALISLARLRAVDSSDDTELVRERALREALHELGHLAGLPHCPRPRCAMTPSALPTDVDSKSDSFCPDCRAELAEAP